MSDSPRVYSDEEFAVILRKAMELANDAEVPAISPEGMTLAEIKSAASQVGLDPALVERAARMLTVAPKASAFERLIGGPIRHSVEVHFPVKLDEHRAALLLSAVRISAGVPGQRDSGHSSPMGITWHDGGPLEALGVTARPEDGGTAVSVAVDRRGTLSLLAMMSAVVLFLTFLFAVFGVGQASPALGAGALVVGVGGIFAVARNIWASSTARVRDRISAAMKAIGKTLVDPKP
jgi:hypothetical protein